MALEIKTVDQNGVPVKGATLCFYRGDSLINTVKVPDNTGILYFDLESDSELFEFGNTIKAKAFGHNTASINADAVRGNWVFVLPDNKQQMLFVAGAVGGAALLYAAAKRNNKKVGGFNAKDAVPFIIPVVAVVGGYIVYQKFFGERKDEKERDSALDAAIAEAGFPSMSEIELSATANAIYEDLQYSWISNDINDAVRQLCKPKNTADVLGLVKAYGRRVLKTFGIPRGSFTLEETVASQVGNSDKEFINDYYASQGIDFSF